MLRSAQKGETQLPDFQRGWVWDDEHIRSLISSVSQSFPIGTVMMLETGNPDVRFKPRLMEGVELRNSPEPEQLILDGQQRLTSLFQALLSGVPVKTKDLRKNEIKRWYYIDIKKALDPRADREDAVIGLSEERLVKNFRGEVLVDYSTPEKEFEAEIFPLAQVKDCSEWRAQYNEYWKYNSDKVRLFDRFEREIIKRFEQYQIPLILMHKDTPKEAVCQVFEKVNTGGVSLTVFELLTATYAADDYNLREHWADCDRRLRRHHVLASMQNTDFLQTITLLATFDYKQTHPEAAVSCKRRDILRLTLEEYKTWADAAVKGFEDAARFLRTQKLFDGRDLPYRTQLAPLAAIFVALDERAENDGVRQKIARWYWCGVLGELYGSAIESRFAKDLPEVIAWIEGKTEPSTITDANFAPNRLLTLRTRNSAAYKGISALLMRDGGQDFRTGEPIDVQLYFDDRIDIHHIFPADYCKTMGYERAKWDSIVNKTPLAGKTNRMISNRAPSIYLPRLERTADISPVRMDEILRSHLIDPALLRSDEFDGFFSVRSRALLERIERVMGKAVLTPTVAETGSFDEDEDIDENGGLSE